MNRQRGHTLIELLAVAVILALLASAAMPVGELVQQRGREHELRRALREIRGALDAYKDAVEDGRIAGRPGGSGFPPRLEDLAAGVVDLRSARRERIYFLRRIPRDPFHPDEALAAAETWGRRSYASAPEAPREGPDVYDVYSRAEGVGLNGQPYRQW